MDIDIFEKRSLGPVFLIAEEEEGDEEESCCAAPGRIQY